MGCRKGISQASIEFVSVVCGLAFFWGAKKLKEVRLILNFFNKYLLIIAMILAGTNSLGQFCAGRA